MKKLQTFCACLLLAVLAGCAAPEPGIKNIFDANALKNPDSGPSVRIGKISDDRKFQKAGVSEGDTVSITIAAIQFPTDPDQPTTYDNRIDDAAFNLRVRRYDARLYRATLLPKDDGVAGFVKSASLYALRSAGYRVLSPGDAGYEQVPAVDISIGDFWSWTHMSGVQIAASCRYSIALSLPTEGGARKIPVSGSAERDSWTTINTADYELVIKLAMTDLEQRLEAELKKH